MMAGLARASVEGVLIAQISQASRWAWVRFPVQAVTREDIAARMSCWKVEAGLIGRARRRMYWPERFRLKVQPPMLPEAAGTIWLENFTLPFWELWGGG